MRAVGISTESVDAAQVTLREAVKTLLMEHLACSSESAEYVAAKIAQGMRRTLANLALIGHAKGARRPRPIDPR